MSIFKVTVEPNDPGGTSGIYYCKEEPVLRGEVLIIHTVNIRVRNPLPGTKTHLSCKSTIGMHMRNILYFKVDPSPALTNNLYEFEE